MTNQTIRVEAFSDGVFAIAITLLILEIKIPPIDMIHSVPDLWRALGKLWPSYFGFFLSFGFILVAWVNHHLAFSLIERSSPSLFFANGFLLLNIVLLPFATALLAEYISSDYIQPAIVVYCFCYVLQNTSWNLIVESITKSNLLKKDPGTKAVFKKIVTSCRYGLVIYIFITILAWWFPMTALILNTMLWFVWLAIGISSPKKGTIAVYAE